MKVISIKIKLELEESDGKDHATELEFKNGLWTTNGPTFPRISSAMSDIFNLLRGRKI